MLGFLSGRFRLGEDFCKNSAAFAEKAFGMENWNSFGGAGGLCCPLKNSFYKRDLPGAENDDERNREK